jgi:hypothetical protein
MRPLSTLLLTLLLTPVLAVPSARAADEPGTKDLASRITHVTVFSDRAQLTRAAAAALDTSPVVYAFRRLPGWVDDGSIRGKTGVCPRVSESCRGTRLLGPSEWQTMRAGGGVVSWAP